MLPNLLIVGGMKCGTTSLHKYLAAHPDVFMSETKELDFFTTWNRREKGIDWYERQFPVAAAVRGESSPLYTAWPHVLGVPEAIAETLPDVKLIYMVRDPVERIVSHYRHALGRGDEERSLAEVIRDPGFEETRYVAQSQYAMQLERYLERFDRSRILVLRQETLDRSREEAIRAVFRFLGVDDDFRSPLFRRRYNVAHDERSGQRALARSRELLGRERFDAVAKRVPRPVRRLADRAFWRKLPEPTLTPDLTDRIVELIAPDTRRLAELTGLRFDGWSTWR